MALSLQSTQPVIFNGGLYNVFVTLDPAHLAQDTGTLTVHGTLAGGTFDSTLNVFFLANFVPIGGGQGFAVPGSGTLSQTGGLWVPTPPPGSVIIRGPDDGSGADKAANLHLGLDPKEVDFLLRQLRCTLAEQVGPTRLDKPSRPSLVRCFSPVPH